MTPPWLHFEDLILDGYAVCSACGLLHRRAFAPLDRHGCSNMECRHIGMREASEVEATPDAPLAVARLSNAEIDQLPNDEGSMIMGIVPCVARDNYGGRSATIRMTGMRHRRVAPIPLSQASIAQQ